MASLFVRTLPGYCLIACIVILGISGMMAAHYIFDLHWAFVLACVTLFAGMLIGVVARDFGYFSRVLQAWPILHKIIDWKIVERLLEVTGDQPEKL